MVAQFPKRQSPEYCIYRLHGKEIHIGKYTLKDNWNNKAIHPHLSFYEWQVEDSIRHSSCVLGYPVR